jgi:hypothetical protein
MLENLAIAERRTFTLREATQRNDKIKVMFFNTHLINYIYSSSQQA